METTKTNWTIPAAIVIAGLAIAGAIYFTRQSAAPKAAAPTVKEVSLRPVSTADHILGNPSAKLIFVEYSDLECPFCKAFQTEMRKMMDANAKDGKVAWVYRQFPIAELHSRAPKESEATECVAELGGNEKFWTYLDSIYATTGSNDTLDPAKLPELAVAAGVDRSAFESCLQSGKYKDKVNRDYEDALSAGGRGTPHTVILSAAPIRKAAQESLLADLASAQVPNPMYFSPDGRKMVIEGATSAGILQVIIDSLLAGQS